VPGEPPAAAARREAGLRAAAGGEELLRPPLPHEAKPGAGIVPTGLVAHAINLIRPAERGLRRSVWHALLTSSVLLFDTLPHAAAYREACTAAGAACGTLITLDCEKVAGNGITDGARPCGPLASLPTYFGAAPADGAADGPAHALRALQAECEALAAAEAALQAATAAMRVAAWAADDEGAEEEEEAAAEAAPQKRRKSGGQERAGKKAKSKR